MCLSTLRGPSGGRLLAKLVRFHPRHGASERRADHINAKRGAAADAAVPGGADADPAIHGSLPERACQSVPAPAGCMTFGYSPPCAMLKIVADTDTAGLYCNKA